MKNYRAHSEYLDKALGDPKEAANYLNAAIEEGDLDLLKTVLIQIVRAHGMAQTARKVSMTRPGLYKSLSPKGNPTLNVFTKILSTAGLQMSFKPLPLHAREKSATYSAHSHR